jgi:hypothetical protein
LRCAESSFGPLSDDAVCFSSDQFRWCALQFYPSLNRSKCCAKGICTGECSPNWRGSRLLLFGFYFDPFSRVQSASSR